MYIDTLRHTIHVLHSAVSLETRVHADRQTDTQTGRQTPMRASIRTRVDYLIMLGEKIMMGYDMDIWIDGMDR